ncbi:unnamed protein product [Clonostachys rosea f. rosea IK726]|jgi:mannose-6-phosphate isomerase-like protein (cupin superfamily)|uniref:Cupin type-2 domain-containing protein n=2 Tax=Bionectria ochroleuca TaxID=29856 RepID=A0A0B7K0F6_BIOOC|nr:unnamed protein product [Clonostachys rosea f. rosea IK726]
MAAPVSVPDVIASIRSRWSPHLVATTNDHDVKVVKIDGAFIWHAHQNTDELFYLISGKLTMEMEEEAAQGEARAEIRNVLMKPGDMFNVPKGVRHRPVAEDAMIMVIEREDTVNTGDQVDSERTRVEKDAR